MKSDIGHGIAYLRGLGTFWRTPINPEELLQTLCRGIQEREQALLRMLKWGIFENPKSPYLPMLRAAGLDEEKVTRLVMQHGVEGSLQRLYESGVYVSLDEFKGNVPTLQRGRLEIPIKAADFNNPTITPHFIGTTGGSRSSGTPLPIDLGDIWDAVPPHYAHLRAYQALDLPFAMWRSTPPSPAMLKVALPSIKIGLPMTKWFSPTPPGPSKASGKGTLILWGTIVVSRLMGYHIPYPVHTPLNRCEEVVRWLAEQTAQGKRHLCSVTVNLAARLCLTAQAMGLDISGHLLRLSSEPVTETKAALLRQAGLDFIANYGLNDMGNMAVSCPNPAYVDEMHVLTHRCAILPVPRTIGTWPEPINTLYHTVLAPRTPKIVLNVESGDYAIPIERRCGCLLEELGFHQRLHTIRSYEKLTSGGVTFMGSALLEILENALPQRFGGGPTDYQLVEREQNGETVVKLVIAPSVGPLNESEVVSFMLDEIARRTRGGTMQATVWRDGQLLTVERRPPYITGTAKIQPLHVERSR